MCSACNKNISFSKSNVFSKEFFKLTSSRKAALMHSPYFKDFNSWLPFQWQHSFMELIPILACFVFQGRRAFVCTLAEEIFSNWIIWGTQCQIIDSSMTQWPFTLNGLPMLHLSLSVTTWLGAKRTLRGTTWSIVHLLIPASTSLCWRHVITWLWRQEHLVGGERGCQGVELYISPASLDKSHGLEIEWNRLTTTQNIG